MSLAFDDFGRPFLLIRQQEEKARLSGIDAVKSNISSARALSNVLKSSLGPMGMDKIFVNSHGDMTITNDGATIMKNMKVDDQIGSLVVQLSQSQDDEVGDGTTSVVVLAGALLASAEKLMDFGIHATKVCSAFNDCSKLTVKFVNSIAPIVPEANFHEFIGKIARISTSSKIVSKCGDKVSELAVEAAKLVTIGRKLDLNSIRILSKSNRDLTESFLFHGLVLEKEFSHPSMSKSIKDCRIAILNCPFEPPRPKTKHQLEIASSVEFKNLRNYEAGVFDGMIMRLKEVGANVVMCQWGFDDEANSLLAQHGISAVRWVMGHEIEQVAIATKGRIVCRFEDLTSDCLGFSPQIDQKDYGGQHTVIFVESLQEIKFATVMLYGSNELLVEEAKRSFHDAICAIRSFFTDPRVLPGGGACEIACAANIRGLAARLGSLDKSVYEAFADSLESIPTAIIQNSGLDANQLISNLYALHRETKSVCYGFDSYSGQLCDMLEKGVYEPLRSKSSVLSLATQLVNMILKIDEVIVKSPSTQH